MIPSFTRLGIIGISQLFWLNRIESDMLPSKSKIQNNSTNTTSKIQALQSNN